MTQSTTGGFVKEMFLILAIILATEVSQVKTELPTQKNCPNMLSPMNDNGTCVFSDHCSKVVCTSPPDVDTGPISHMAVQALVCNQSVKANVSLESSSVKWSHTFKDGEKVALPDAMKPSDAPASMKQFLIVELEKHGPYNTDVHFKLVLMFDFGYMNYNTTFLEGNLEAAECECHVTVFPTPMISGGDEEDCPDIQLPDGSDGTCYLDNHCSKVTCLSPPDSTGPFSHMVLTVQAYGCHHQPVKAKVSLESSSVKWSHTFKDGEKATMPDNMKPPDVPADMKIFLEMELKKNGGKVHFKVQKIIYFKAA
ncbi:uncharacterized protein LOC110052948 isoform X1 [Orbicella faveolata]|uniref:uncharacterized protein LOC110052948 isoform X1 n=2 Tax=Orbicella faveolata TaxID=48498 RepID=UPI0009E5FC66|nr:uncharacterized protein LOC110052948 isoform X1 [Orbicella faveolata]